jgi:NAD(P)-dependent dehydrogenase (short-subunit alcohol dehydrogenase family)
MTKLQDQVVFITGPARGIGEAVARGLAARGARLALAGREPERLAALALELGPRHLWFDCDVTNQEQVTRAVEETVRVMGGIDVVVANAGIAPHGSVAATPMDALARVIDVNVTGVIRTVHATLPHVTARRGYFLLIASAAAFAPQPGLATYAASKAAVEQFGNALRLEVLRDGAKVGVAHPCWIDTDMVRDSRHDLPTFDNTLRKLPGPFGRVTSVETCAVALIDAIERRRRKIYIPRSLAPFAFFRHIFFMSRVADLTIGKPGQKSLGRIEHEVQTAGRVFGEHSVETKGGGGAG